MNSFYWACIGFLIGGFLFYQIGFGYGVKAMSFTIEDIIDEVVPSVNDTCDKPTKNQTEDIIKTTKPKPIGVLIHYLVGVNEENEPYAIVGITFSSASKLHVKSHKATRRLKSESDDHNMYAFLLDKQTSEFLIIIEDDIIRKKPDLNQLRKYGRVCAACSEKTTVISGHTLVGIDGKCAICGADLPQFSGNTIEDSNPIGIKISSEDCEPIDLMLGDEK